MNDKIILIGLSIVLLGSFSLFLLTIFKIFLFIFPLMIFTSFGFFIMCVSDKIVEIIKGDKNEVL